MKAILCAIIVVAGIALGADYVIGGSVFDTGGSVLNSLSAGT